MVREEYNQIIREHFDLSDKNTRKYIATLEDADQSQLLAALSSALYDQIVSKVDDIDFGSIPMSRGDITKVEGFNRTEECINIIRNFVVEYKQKPDVVDTISTAIYNIKERKAQFTKAYALNAELPMLLYNLITLSIERSVSFVISACIDFVKDGNSTFKMSFDKIGYKNTADDMMFKQLQSFNTLCKNKTIDKVINGTLKVTNESFEDSFDLVDPMHDMQPTPDIAPEVKSPVIDENPGEGFDPTDIEDIDSEPTDDTSDDMFDDIDPEDDTSNSDISNDIDDDVMGLLDDDIEDTVEPQNIPSVQPTDSIHSEPEKVLDEKEVNEAKIDIDKLDKIKSAIKKPGNEVLAKLKKHKVLAIAAAGTVALVAMVKLVIPFIKLLIYELMYSSVKFSDYLEIQAQLIEAHADDIANSTDMDENEKKKVIEKQRKWAERFRKWANVFSLDKKASQNKAKSEAKNKKNKIGVDDDGDDVLF